MTTISSELDKLAASEVMNPNVMWADATESLRTASERMMKQGIRALLVPGRRDGDLPGILSSKDIVNLICAHDPAILDQLVVDDAVSRPAVCVPETANVIDCINLMRTTGIRRAPVVRGTEVIGILSFSDVLARLLSS
ncbi:MAG: CBS domain-containing protein [bacterium]|nr:CBS domain-containing protein [bacterium]